MKRTLWIEIGALLALGGLGLYGGLAAYLRSDARTQSSSLQPGMFVSALSLLLIVTAVVYAYARWRSLRARPPAASEPAASGAVVWLVYAVIVLYAVLIELVGYVPATLLFLLAQFRLLGVTSWVRNAALAVAASAIFYVVFVHYAAMVFPRGAFLE